MRKPVSLAIVLVTVTCLTSCGLPSETEKPKAKHRPASASTNDERPVRWGNWELVGDFEVQTDPVFSGQKELTFSVKNLKKEPDSGIFTITFLRDGKRVGDVVDECSTATGFSSPDVGPQQVVEVECDDIYPPKTGGWDEVRIKDTY